MKLADWPCCTAPTSASSTLASRIRWLRSSPSVNSVTACKDAATALPGSTVRASTTPSMGERIDDFDRFVSSVDSVARVCVTTARALSTLALARATAARAVSSSAAEGTRPPDRRATSSKRPSVARASRTVASFCASAACAALSAARERLTVS